jgi:GNAT superfamily N-acetyltransferase
MSRGDEPPSAAQRADVNPPPPQALEGRTPRYHPSMEVVALADAATFLTRSAPVLGRDPAANNLPLGIAQQLVDRPGSYASAQFWVAERDGEVLGAAMRTPPYPAVLADPIGDGAAVIDAFVAELMLAEPSLPGVTANEPWASRFAEAWTGATGRPWRRSVGQGVYALTEVRRPPRPAAGWARPATLDDRTLLRRWMDAFAAEALQAMPRDEGDMQRSIDARVGADASGGFALWEHDGRPVSLTGWMPITGGARVGPVYTPPEERGHGYASSLVAHVSAQMLERGAAACFLYTDLGNPTSNAIYSRIGYEQVAESSMILFDEQAERR